MTWSKACWVWLALPLVSLSYGVSVRSTLVAQTVVVTAKDVLPIFEKNCFQCHGEDLQEENLDLRTRETMLKGGDKGPSLVPGKAEESLIYIRVIGHVKPQMPMEPLPPLSEKEMLTLKNWIDQGANWDASTSVQTDRKAPGDKANASYLEYQERVITNEMRQWWAFKKPVRHELPDVSGSRWSAKAIDRFIKAKMDANGLTPAPQADRTTLLRRVYLDLTGLLPTPEQVDAFVNDPSPRAYEELVEELLVSHHYGERWARFWLDVVRYADSSGFEHDRTLDTAWRYRDYVIKALNEDKPYNEFLIEQIAGDELDEPTNDSLTATAFYRFGPRVRFREQSNPYYRYDYLDDIVRTTFNGFMGLSVHCARCHDHKFDPITRMDYYRSIGMFFGYVRYDHLLAPTQEADEWVRAKQKSLKAIAPLKLAIAKIEAPYREQEFEENLKTLPEDVQIAVKTPIAKRTQGQRLLAAQFELDFAAGAALKIGEFQRGDELGPIVFSATNNTDYRKSPLPGGALKFAERNRAAQIAAGLSVPPLVVPPPKLSPEDEGKRKALQDEIAAIEEKMLRPLPAIEGVRDGDYRLAPPGPGDGVRPGNYQPKYGKLNDGYLPKPGQRYEVPAVHFGANGLVVEEDLEAPIVKPGFLTVLSKGDEPVTRPPNRSDYVSSGRRRALAEWIVSPENALTSRVLVNRLWYWHFGTGIVSTPGNFGKMGMPPTHPELLDWLATEFVRQRWSIKQMHRLILNSETYKMASGFYSSQNVEQDPTNTFLWRYPVRRLEGEAIRDVVLSASGQLNLKAGGEPFYPALAESVREGYQGGKWILTKEGPATWRRSIYAYWKRGLKFPLFDIHDQPDQNVTTEKRNVSTVPTQALTLINGEFMLLQARYLADRVIKEAPGDATARVKRLYLITLGREPNAQELTFSLDFLHREREFQVAEAADRSADQAALTNLSHVLLNTNEFLHIN